MEIVRINQAIGARITGIDFSAGLDAAVIEAIGAALMEHQVVSIAAEGMTGEQQLAIASQFGTPEHHEFFQNLGPGLEHVTVLDSEQGDRADRWHVDELYLAKPPAVTTLHGKILPPFGGDTAFISLAAAYDRLSSRMKTYLDGLVAVHDYARMAEIAWQSGGSSEAVAAAVAERKIIEHPLVHVHPVTGRRSLRIDTVYTRFIKGLPEREGRALLNFLLEHSQRPEFGYRHHWQPGDFLLWDNRSVMHYAVSDYSSRRRMYRVSVMADE
jgi:taurine dioxygenase